VVFLSPAELSMLITLSTVGPDMQRICISYECADYRSSIPPSYQPFWGGIEFYTPGQDWEITSDGRCIEWFGSGRLLTNTGHVINEVCERDDGFTIFFTDIKESF